MPVAPREKGFLAASCLGFLATLVLGYIAIKQTDFFLAVISGICAFAGALLLYMYFTSND